MLRQPAADGREAAVRWRQLVDLIARAGAAADPELLVQALKVIREDSPRIDESLRAAAARAIAALPLPLGLLETFVADRLSVSAPIIAAASLEASQWRVLLAGADAETRRFIETLHPDLGELAPLQAPGAAELSIGELVSRIERRRSERTRAAGAAGPAPLAAAEPGLFLWEAGANGEIDWVEGVPRGAMIGRSLARAADGGERVGEDMVRAFTERAPFRECELVVAGEGPAAGRWLVSGAPAFDSGDGRFRGYRGNARRELEAAPPKPNLLLEPHLPLDADSLRELVHELKTPLNAIIGFAEIIDGQFLGPAGRAYRDRANDIAGEARLLLSAIDDLDQAAKTLAVSSGRGSAALDAVVSKVADAFGQSTRHRGVNLAFATPTSPVQAAIEPALLERLVERIVRAVIDVAANGERLRLEVEQRGLRARFAISRPAALARDGAGDGDYSLQLARGLARIVGGDVIIEDKVVAADFPAP